MISNIPMEKLLWGCIALSTLTFVTSFNLPGRDPSASKNETTPANASSTSSTTPATDLNATTVSTNNSSSISNSSDFNNSTMSNNGTNSTGGGSLDDRFNFNLNLAGAKAHGKDGGYSQSDALSYGLDTGIKKPGEQTQILSSNNGSQSSTLTVGHGAPLTHANTSTGGKPGFGFGGTAAAWIEAIQGGKGNTYAQSINQHHEVPLDDKGTVFFSNLKERENGTSSSTEASASSTTSSSSTSLSPITVSTTIASTTTSKKKLTDPLVFS